MIMEELLAESGSISPMGSNKLSSSPNIRYLGFRRPPESTTFAASHDHDPLELHESDVVWSFAISSSPPIHQVRRFYSPKSGLTAALSDDQHHLIRRKSNINLKITPPPAWQEDIPERFHQSAPVNTPLWPAWIDSEKWEKFEADFEGDDDAQWEEEMAPPHVIVARSHVTFSVFEGAGRTLKGRDLRRVRNAVFQKTEYITVFCWKTTDRYI